jgi:uncharacterized membrane protein
MKHKRLAFIDLLRGAAILIMILANSSPYLLSPPYPFMYRMISSLAAPLFIFLSGYSLAYTFHYKKDTKDKIIQAVYLLMSASLLDALVWHICPFQTFDVLYCIGAGILINTFLIRIRMVWSAALIVLIFMSLWLIRPYLPYRMDMIETPVPMFFSSVVIDVRRMLLDGWFPLFPWLLFSITGALVFRVQSYFIKFQTHIRIITGLVALISFFPFYFVKSSQLLRKEYVELFYPPDITYVLFALSMVLFLFALLFGDKTYRYPLLNQLQLLGKNSLFVYLLHAIIISYIFQPFFTQGSPIFFSTLMVVFLSVLTLAAHTIQSLKIHHKLLVVPKPIRRLLGLM